MASNTTLWAALASAGEVPAASYASFNVRNNRVVLEFDATAQETVFFTGFMPRSYAGGGITVQLHWMAATATAGTIGWDVSIERVSDSATDLDSDSFAAAQTVNAVEVNATSGVPSTGSAAFTNGSQMDNVVAGDLFRLRVRRDVATDTAAGDAQLLGIEVRES